MMTFEDLHRDLDCDCFEPDGIAENTADTFARRVRHNPPRVADFNSFFQEGKPCRNPDDCEYLCKYRGVSINKVETAREAKLKSTWAEIIRFRPKTPRLYCKFRLKEGAGKVWPTPTRNDSDHHTLLKSDQFKMKLVEIIEVVNL